MESIPFLPGRTGARDKGDWFSRPQGALGEAAFRRLACLHFVIVGAGRLGSTLAHVLARDGVQHLSLVDPDRVEDHNVCGGFGPTVADVGKYKVNALAAALCAIHPAMQVEALPVSITSLRALEAVAAADMLITTPDDDAARLAATWLAALFLKPHLDLGVGIWEEDSRRRMGADVRLVWPGRCLLCAGGLRDDAAAQAILLSAEAEEQARLHPRHWRELRAGSLASLNAVAAGVGGRMVEEFVAGSLVENGSWTRLEFGREGQLQVHHLRVPPPGTAGCCCRFAGLGDDGLAEVVKQISETALRSRRAREENRGA